MEHKFYTDNFERLLKEKSDEFRMYPSKRVWHSIYNDLHPDRKWPSIAVSLVLVTILFLIGYWNNNLTTANTVAGQQKALPTTAVQAKKDITLTGTLPAAPTAAGASNTNTSTVLYNTVSVQAAQDNFRSAPVTAAAHNRTVTEKTVNKNTAVSGRFTSGSNRNSNNTGNTVAAASDIAAGTAAADQYPSVRNASKTIVTGSQPRNQSAAAATATFAAAFNSNHLTAASTVNGSSTDKTMAVSTNEAAEEITVEPANDNSSLLLSQAGNANAIPVGSSLTSGGHQKLAPKPTAAKLQAAAGQLTQDDRGWMEHYALYNKPAKKWWKGRLSSEIYFTPGVALRKMTANTDYALAYASITNNITSPGNNTSFDQLNYNPGLTFEAGAGVSYAIAKNIRLKTALQFNFNNYSIDVAEINHPVLTTLLLTDISTGNTYQEGRRSSLANIPGYNKHKVHNQTSQISLPVGLAVKLKNGSKFEWYAGAAIQPSYILGGKASLISFDHKNYVSDPAMIRSWNLNTAFETYIHYKLNGFTLQAGPQFRYQMMSTYSKKYTYSESLYNIGLKIGLVKNF